MAGAMRRMGVYLGLVEDDDTRGGYDRYAARQSDYDHDDRGYDRGYDRYPAADYDDEPAPADPGDRYGYGGGYAGAGYESEYPTGVADDRSPERAPEPEVSLGRRPAPSLRYGQGDGTRAPSRVTPAPPAPPSRPAVTRPGGVARWPEP